MTRLGHALAGPEWILADCGRHLAARNLTATVAVALERREVTLAALAILVTEHPRVPGVTALRGCLKELAGGAQSIREVDTLLLLRKLGLPVPECQVWIYDDHGRLVAIADFYWEGVACFFDGADHFRFAALKADRRKRDRLEALELQVAVVTGELLAEPTLFGDRVRAALNAAAAVAAARTGPPRWRTERASPQQSAG